ncbi:MAG: twin-arginine translocation signal domain-containing protein, partial [Pseudonocardia sp.]
MISRRTFLSAAAASAAALSLGACAPRGSSDDSVIRYWGMGAADADKDLKVIDAFKATKAGSRINID